MLLTFCSQIVKADAGCMYAQTDIGLSLSSPFGETLLQFSSLLVQRNLRNTWSTHDYLVHLIKNTGKFQIQYQNQQEVELI